MVLRSWQATYRSLVLKCIAEEEMKKRKKKKEEEEDV